MWRPDFRSLKAFSRLALLVWSRSPRNALHASGLSLVSMIFLLFTPLTTSLRDSDRFTNTSTFISSNRSSSAIEFLTSSSTLHSPVTLDWSRGQQREPRKARCCVMSLQAAIVVLPTLMVKGETLRNPLAKLATCSGIVALKRTTCRSGRTWFMRYSTCLRMGSPFLPSERGSSSSSSASSMTMNVVRSRFVDCSFSMLVSLPGVATAMSTLPLKAALES
mmetsp:Transcript_25543/g.59473  ORF Transcript_25543/g.59473 Transcript_25543/m.59473 type:complete len:220 (-) Transcript_25543:582-1241(-)